MRRSGPQILVEEDRVDVLAGERIQDRPVLATAIGGHEDGAALRAPAAVLFV
jgi:hypothetical protein